MKSESEPDTGGNRRSVALVPVRAGSKGLIGKNARNLSGKPLYRHAVDVAIEAGIERVVISTDIEEILSDGQLPAGVKVMERPVSLCGDDVPMAPVLVHALAQPIFDGDPMVVLLQATTPLRRASDVAGAVRTFSDGSASLVMSVCPADSGVLKYGTVESGRFVALRSQEHVFSNRQALPPVVKPNGAIYVFGAEWFRRRGTLATESIAPYEMSVEDSVDIDTLEDFERVERILQRRQKEET